MATYSATSPYYNTSVVNKQYLDVMSNRKVPASKTDQRWEINQTYHLRPDLLAFDLYQDSSLWWVFAQRNPNTLKDPLFDFVAGTTIYLPKADMIKAELGIK